MAHADNIRSDNKFMRLAVLLEPEIARMLELQAVRTQGHDDVLVDTQRGAVTYLSRGQVVWEVRAEVVGAYLPDFGLWRWWWTGRMVSDGRAKCSMDLALSEGQRHGIASLTGEHPRVASEEDAELLSTVCAHLARADGVFRFQDDEKFTYYALFETGKARNLSMPPLRGGSPGASSMRPGGMLQGSLRPPAVPAMPPVGERMITPLPAAPRRTVAVPRQAVPIVRNDGPIAPSALDGLGGLSGMGVPQLSLGGAARHDASQPIRGLGPLPDVAHEPASPADTGAQPARPSEPRAARYSVPDLDDPFAASEEPKTGSMGIARETTSTAMMTMAPQAAMHRDPSRTQSPIREPAREIVIPLVQAAVAGVAASFPNGFHQALIVVNLESLEGKARFATLVCASDESGELVLVDTPRELMEATGRMIAEDARAGNGRWRRMVVKLSRTQRGAAIDVSVK